MSAEIIMFPVKDPPTKVNPKASKKIRFEIPEPKQVKMQPPKSPEEYLGMCKKMLRKEQYEDILCGILDEEIYETLESPYKKIIDLYFNL